MLVSPLCRESQQQQTNHQKLKLCQNELKIPITDIKNLSFIFFHLVKKMIEIILILLDILALNETNHEGEVYTNHRIMKRTVYYIRISLPN